MLDNRGTNGTLDGTFRRAQGMFSVNKPDLRLDNLRLGNVIEYSDVLCDGACM